jgi:Transposase, Mutator family
MIQAALEMEVSEFWQRAKYDKTEQCGFRGYRNGHHQSRTVSTAVGGLQVRVPRVSDNPQKYESQLVKPYQRRSEGLNNLFPKLFIEGLSTRDFEPSLRFLAGEQAALSPSAIYRLNKQFKTDYENWQKVDLSEKKFYCIYADGVYLSAGIALEKACFLVISGIDEFGEKHLLSYGDVEHFRPKGGVRQDEKDKLLPVDYFWLAYEWSNLFLACQICNQRFKKNLFPLEDKNKRAKSHLDNCKSRKTIIHKP